MNTTHTIYGMNSRNQAPTGWRLSAPYLTPHLIRAKRFLYPQALYSISIKQKVVALTFDDGPSCFTPRLLDLLKQENVKATFFVLKNRFERYPDILLRCLAEGHQIALHGCTHRSPLHVPGKDIQRELNNEIKSLTELLGSDFRPLRWYYRPPFLHLNHRVIKAVESKGIRFAMCSILPGLQLLLPDGWQEPCEIVIKRVLKELRPGDIICLHDGEDIGIHDNVYHASQTPETSATLIGILKTQGYTFATVEELESMRCPTKI